MASGSELTPFSSPVIDVTNPTSIIAASDVYFFNSQIDLCSVSSFDLSAGFKLSLDGCSFIRGIIIGEDVSVPTSSLEMSNSAYIYGITASNLNLLGEIVVREPVTFEGNTINKGKLYPAINSIIYLKDNFTNEGSIDNGLNLMTINVSGDITNSGTWTNNHTKLVGSAEQHVLLVNDMTINNELFYFTSELSTAPFQWYYNSEILDSPDFTGETSQEMQMYQKVMGPAYYGTYYCATGEGNSRNIIIEGITYYVPEITSIVNDGSNVDIIWNDIPTALSYNIFSSDDPYADPAAWTPVTEVFTNSCTLADQTENKKFYFVKAVY